MMRKKNNMGRDMRGRSRRHKPGGGSGGGNHGGEYGPNQKRHAMAQRDKYTQMANNAIASGDRVEAEYYFQHVDHYNRVLNTIREQEGPQHSDDTQAQGQQQGHHHGGHQSHHHTPRHHEPAVASDAQEPAPEEAVAAVEEIPLPTSIFSESPEDRQSASGA